MLILRPRFCAAPLVHQRPKQQQRPKLQKRKLRSSKLGDGLLLLLMCGQQSVAFTLAISLGRIVLSMSRLSHLQVFAGRGSVPASTQCSVFCLMLQGCLHIPGLRQSYEHSCGLSQQKCRLIVWLFQHV